MQPMPSTGRRQLGGLHQLWFMADSHTHSDPRVAKLGHPRDHSRNLLHLQLVDAQIFRASALALTQRKPLTECLMAPVARAVTLPGDAQRRARSSNVERQTAEPTRLGFVRLARAPSGAG